MNNFNFILNNFLYFVFVCLLIYNILKRICFLKFINLFGLNVLNGLNNIFIGIFKYFMKVGREFF